MIILQRTKVVVCPECESILIPININIEIEIAYEPAYDFRKHFISCDLCPYCMRLIRSEEYKKELQPIIKDINDIMMEYETFKPKIKFLNIEINKNSYLDYKKEFVLKTLIEEYVFSDLKYVAKTGDEMFQNTQLDQKMSKEMSVEKFLNSIKSMIDPYNKDNPF